jgi:hypothetical protein
VTWPSAPQRARATVDGDTEIGRRPGQVGGVLDRAAHQSGGANAVRQPLRDRDAVAVVGTHPRSARSADRVRAGHEAGRAARLVVKGRCLRLGQVFYTRQANEEEEGSNGDLSDHRDRSDSRAI